MKPISTQSDSTMTAPARTAGQFVSLTGRFFHTTEECAAGIQVAAWQGRVIGYVTADVLLVELFEWVMGEPTGQQPIPLTDLLARNPVFYETADDMRFSYEHGTLRHSSRCEHQDEGP